MSNKKRVFFQLDESTHAALKAYAAEQRLTMMTVVETAIKSLLKRSKK